MNLGQMEAEISLMINDASLTPFLVDWINNAILEIAADLELMPLKLVDPVTLAVDTSKWLWAMPTSFHKKLFKVKWTDTYGASHHIHIVDHIDHLSGKDHTLTADSISEVGVAVQGLSHSLGVYPLADATLSLWYYRLPAVLAAPADLCDCLPPGFERRLLYPKLIIQNYQFIVDQVAEFPVAQGPLQYWQALMDKGQQDLKNFFAKVYNKPRRHGGRDPIGPSRRYFRGNYNG